MKPNWKEDVDVIAMQVALVVVAAVSALYLVWVLLT